jgi:hypothetical protein
MEIPVSDRDGNDPRNPNDGKYSGIFTSTDGVVIQFVPQSSLPVFPPNGLDINGNPIVPVCSKSQTTNPSNNQLLDYINKLCVNGALFGLHAYPWQSGSVFTQDNYAVITATILNANLSYQQDPTV